MPITTLADFETNFRELEQMVARNKQISVQQFLTEKKREEIEQKIQDLWDYSLQYPEEANKVDVPELDTEQPLIEDHCNYGHTVCSSEVDVKYPATIDDLVCIIKTAIDDKKQVKAMGPGHSYSTITALESGNTLIQTDKLTGFEPNPVAFKSIKNPDGTEKLFVSVLGGTNVQDLINLLEGKNMAMSNLGASAVQSIAGLVNTSTHGSGMDFGPICDSVRSILLVNGKGELIRIEPDLPKPVTAFTGNYTIETHIPEPKFYPVELIRDTKTFNAALVNMGAFGVIYSLVLEVVPEFLLQENREFSSWDKVKTDYLNNIKQLEPFRHFEIYINPFDNCEVKKRCIVTHRVIATLKVNEGPGMERNCYLYLGKYPLVPKITYRIFQLLDKLRLNKLACLLLQGSLGKLEDNIKNGTQAGYTDDSYKVFNAQLQKYEILGTGIECCVPFDNARIFIDELLDKIAQINNSPDFPLVSVPLGIRFVKASHALLSMMNGKEDEWFCTVEIPALSFKPSRNAYDRSPILELQRFIFEKHTYARMHWGLSYTDPNANFPYNDYLITRYPNSYKDWEAVRRTLDPNGMFRNEFIQKLTANIILPT